MYARAAYGSNPNPWLENTANGWPADYAWPNRIPSSALGTVHTRDGTPIVVLAELVPLVARLVWWTEHVMGYAMHNPDGSGGWTGGYECRPIGGTSTPSAHSRGRAIDVLAQANPQSRRFVSTWPPAVIAGWESCGFYWGGRYVGAKFDTMHVSYIGRPDQVAGHLAVANALPGGSAEAPRPVPPTQEDDMPLSDDDLAKIGAVIDARIAAALAATYPVVDETTVPPGYRATIPAMIQRAVRVGGIAAARTVPTTDQITAAVKAAGASGAEITADQLAAALLRQIAGKS